jgi:xanthine dehydrogenase YagS FAD-binding subunit
MKSFEYLQPETIKAASKHLQKNNNSFPYAGGTDLLGLMKDEIIAPNQLVNLKNLGKYNFIEYDENEGLRIGALTKLSEIEEHPIVKEKYKVLAEAIAEIATLQLRNVGTLGGNICQRPRCFYFRGDYECIRKGGDTCFAITGNNKFHCIIGGGPCYIVHPSDTAVALIAMDAKFKVFNGKEEKIISAKDFFILPEVDDTRENILNNGDLLLEIILPSVKNKLIGKYIKVKERGAWDFAMVSIAGVFNKEGNKIKNGKIAFGGVAPIPWEEEIINSNLTNLILNESEITKLSNYAFTKAEEMSMNSYKIKMARNLIKKILLELL